MWTRTRSIVFAIAAASLIIGLAAGIQIARHEGDSGIRITLGGNEPYFSKPAQISQNFFNPTAPTKKPAASSSPKAAQKTQPAPPSDGITAESYIVGDLVTGDIYLEKDPDIVLPFASMSKLVTALVETNLYASDTPITISSSSGSVYPDLSGIRTGETYTAGELIYPLLMDSSNIAAEAFASGATSTDRAGFMGLMEGYSWEIGMPHAHFADPSGLDAGNSGTARGFLAMAQYLYKSRPDILAVTRTQTYSFATTSEHGAHQLVNIHPFAADPRFLGGKTGHTNAALDTMLTILDISDHPVAFIVLRSQDRTKDTDLLIDKLAAEGMKPIPIATATNG